MLTFLRKIRKSLIDSGRSRKYLLYAIGEIGLVVIGILLALQINNWNENRKKQIAEQESIDKFVLLLEIDSILFSQYLQSLDTYKVIYDELFEMIVNGNKEVDLVNPEFIRAGVAYFPVTIDYNQEITSQISNDSVRDKVIKYFHIEKRVNVGFEEFKTVIKDRMRIFLAQKEIHDLAKWYTTIEDPRTQFINREDLITLSKDGQFQQLLLEASIKLRYFESLLEDLLEYNNYLRDFLSGQKKGE